MHQQHMQVCQSKLLVGPLDTSALPRPSLHKVKVLSALVGSLNTKNKQNAISSARKS